MAGPFTLQNFKQDTLSADMSSGATSATLTSGNFTTDTNAVLIFDYDSASKREICLASVNGTAVTSITRAQGGTSAVEHSSGAKVIMAFSSLHYAALLDGTAGFAFDKVRVTKSGNQTINTGSTTAVTFDSETFDTNSLHSTSSNTSRLTAAKAGYYLIIGICRWGTESATGYTSALLRHQGSTTFAFNTMAASATLNAAQVVSNVYALAAGEYVELMAEQNSGGDKTLTSTGTVFMMTQIA